MAMASTLCQLCQTIPLQDLPRFPEESYLRILSGQPNLHEAVHNDNVDSMPDPLGFHHHNSLENLRRASTSGCELCRLIEVEVDALLADIADPESKYLPLDPCFDLWITGRPEGEDGMWVVTASASGGKESLFIVATLGFGSDHDDPLALTFRGRRVSRSPDHNVLDRAATWVTQCNATHEECTSHDRSLPTRVIDVGTSDAGSLIKLIEVDKGAKGNYVALSYCWGVGTNHHFTTRRDSLIARKAGIHLSDLPQTLQDAVVMVRLLGIRYLWIDSLCICQDDLVDWERESALMASVYSNAYLTIAATSRPDSSGGLFFERPSNEYLRVPLKTAGGIEGHLLIFRLNKAKEFIKSYRIEMNFEPLSERAWAFQERVLARRLIHFASDQISFECLEGSLYEDGLQLPDRYHSVYSRPPTDAITEEEHEPQTSTLNHRHRTHWNTLLADYSALKLTRPADKLPALAGIAKVYSKLLDDEYMAGIWRKSMVEGLCWQAFECNAVSGPYRAPSWSWASVDGRLAATEFLGQPEFLATIVDHQVDIDGDNPFGRVKSGWIKIKAPLIPLTLSETTGPEGNMLLKAARCDDSGRRAIFDTIDESYKVSAGMIRDMKLFALALVVEPFRRLFPETIGDTFYLSLIVTPTEGVESSATSFGVVKRVGTILLSSESFGPNDLNNSRATVTLV